VRRGAAAAPWMPSSSWTSAGTSAASICLLNSARTT
jgi:hypothetical protein